MGKEYVVYLYNEILFSHKKNNEIMPFVVTWRDLEIINVIMSEISHLDKGKYHMI